MNLLDLHSKCIWLCVNIYSFEETRPTREHPHSLADEVVKIV